MAASGILWPPLLHAHICDDSYVTRQITVESYNARADPKNLRMLIQGKPVDG